MGLIGLGRCVGVAYALGVALAETGSDDFATQTGLDDEAELSEDDAEEADADADAGVALRKAAGFLMRFCAGDLGCGALVLFFVDCTCIALRRKEPSSSSSS